MNIRFYFQEINKVGQEELEKHLGEKKLDRLTRLFQYGNLELAKFVLNAKYHRHLQYLCGAAGAGDCQE